MKIKRNSWAFQLCKIGERDIQQRHVIDTCVITRSFIVGLVKCAFVVGCILTGIVYPMIALTVALMIAVGARLTGVDVAVSQVAGLYDLPDQVMILGVLWWMVLFVVICAWGYIRTIQPLLKKGHTHLSKAMHDQLTPARKKWMDASWGSLTSVICRQVDID